MEFEELLGGTWYTFTIYARNQRRQEGPTGSDPLYVQTGNRSSHYPCILCLLIVYVFREDIIIYIFCNAIPLPLYTYNAARFIDDRVVYLRKFLSFTISLMCLHRYQSTFWVWMFEKLLRGQYSLWQRARIQIHS